MGTITSSVGLASGLDISGIITKLMSLEKRPADLLQKQIDSNTSLQGLLQSLSIRLASSRLSVGALSSSNSFAKRTATASSDAVKVDASLKTPIGSYTFSTRQLVSTSQKISSGFTDVGSFVGAGTISIRQGGFVDQSARVGDLNGGQGFAAGSIRLVDSTGAATTVDLSAATTASEIIDAINASGSQIKATVQGKKILLGDLSSGAGTAQVQEVNGGKTAASLGLTNLSRNGQIYSGTDIYTVSRDTALFSLNNGNGIRNAGGANDFQVSNGTQTFAVNTFGLRSMGEVIDAINNASTTAGAGITASINTSGQLQLAGAGTITVTALASSLAARDLGLEGSAAGTLVAQDRLGSMNSVLLDTLKGGFNTGDTPVTAGTVTITGAGSANIDFSAARTLDDVITSINNQKATTGVSARVNKARNGVELYRSDTTTPTGSITVADVTGDLAQYLNLNQTSTTGTLNSGDLSPKYVNGSTKLNTYAFGGLVPKGKFSLTDGNGVKATVDLTQDSDDTVGDVIQEINSKGLGILARINDTGDGILLERTSGTAEITVTDLEGGGTAKALGLAGSSTTGLLNARRTVQVTTTLSDTLTTTVDKIAKAAGTPALATIVNDGTGLNPYRLSLTSSLGGKLGDLMVDSGATKLNFSTVTKAADAVILYGSSGPGGNPIQLVSSKNSFEGIVPGLTVEAKRVSNEPITVSITSNTEQLAKDIGEFVTAINGVKSLIAENSTYDKQTGKKGAFFSEAGIRLASTRIDQALLGRFNATGNIKTLGQVGITIDDKGQFQFDEDEFQAAFARSPADVEDFFGNASSGFKVGFERLIDTLSGGPGATVSNQLDAIGRTIETQNSALARMNARLEVRQQVLLRQFVAMENAISGLQSQQSALSNLSNLASSFRGQV